MPNLILAAFLAFQSVMSLVISIIVLRKDFKNKINRVFSGIFFFWTFFYGLEAIWLVLDSNADFAFANLLRDISLLGGIWAAALVLLGVWLMIDGTNDLRFYIPWCGLLICGSVIGTILDYIQYDNSLNQWTIQTDLIGQIFAAGTPAVYLLVSAILLLGTIRDIEDPIIKKKAQVLVVALGLGILAVIFIIIAEFGIVPPTPISPAEFLLLACEITVFWSLK